MRSEARVRRLSRECVSYAKLPGMLRHFTLSLVCASVLGLVVGCQSDPEPRPLGADQFYRPTDRGGALPPGPKPTPEPPAPQPTLAQQQQAEAFRVVAAQVKSPATQPTTAPANVQAFAQGQFINLGGVIAQVNGNPIYANEVLRTIAPVLAGRAKDLELPAFQQAAGQEINRQVDDMIRAEVEFAAADQNTGGEDKQNADRMTEGWRDRMITDNKGSIEEARRAFREQGRSFDDAAREQYRISLVRVYYSKKLFPRIQVSAEDMRRYYEKNRDAQFTDRDNATFRLIKVTAKDAGSDAAAKAKIDEIHAKATKGEDFVQLATDFNQDAFLKKNQGLLGPFDRGAYVVDEIDKAIWKLNPGELTPIIKVQDAYYFARLEEKKLGRVKAFEEDEVQKKMNDAIRGEQFSKMRREMETQLRKESVVTKNPEMYQNTLDMAVQNYPKWREQ